MNTEMSTHTDNCVLLFAKSPTRGQVKTRLAAEIGEESAAGLYKCFVEDSVSRIESIDAERKVCYYPAEAKSEFSKWLGKQHCCVPQQGDNLGERLKNAFSDAFGEGFSKVAAIGSDSPDLPVEFLQQAFRAFASHDAVVGPSSDGGYYLIGFSRSSFLPDAFDNIAWSSDAVFEQTVCLLRQHGLTVRLLPLWHDIDTAADIKSLLLRSKNTPFEKSKTYLCLKADGLWSALNV